MPAVDAMNDEQVRPRPSTPAAGEPAASEPRALRRETDGGSGERRQGAAPAAGDMAAPGRGRRRRIVLLLALVLVGASIGTGYWYLTRDQESTDDAFIDGNVVHIRPQVSGPIAALHITDNQRVAQGDLLIEIDPRDFVAARDQAAAALGVAKAQADAARVDLEMIQVQAPARLAAAKAQLAGALATLKQADAEAQRQTRAGPRVSAQADIDIAVANAAAAAATVDRDRAEVEMNQLVQQDIAQAKARIEQLEAQVRQAQAQLDQADLNLSYTRISAPADGLITHRAVNVGDVVQRNQTLTDLVVGTSWVTANFKETQLTRMRPGQPVDIEIDAYPDHSFKGHVDSIQAGTGAHFSLLPPENATGNYVKVVQRVPVKIVFDDPQSIEQFLALGLSVVPTVDVGAAPEPQTAENAAGPTGEAAPDADAAGDTPDPGKAGERTP
ncbi:MAG TPA: HlyD family secretion protein [Geminicoccaceae bacterium]|nr:HlyD family secretion protein [Geminicoccaceae bacterium]